MEKSKFSEVFNNINIIDILENSKIGLWSIEIDNNTGINRMYCNDIMMQLMGIETLISPEKVFEFWYSRIHKGYYSYVENAIQKIGTTDKLIEIQYIWKHPQKGDINVRCSGKFISNNNGIVVIEGYHQNIYDLEQMKIDLPKTENEVFEWYQDSKTAYIRTEYKQLYEDKVNIENFPQVWIDNKIVHKDFKDLYLETFERVNKGSKKSFCELKMKNKNGEYIWFRMILSKEANYLSSGIVIGTLEDINNLKQLEISYVIGSKFYKSILQEMIAYGEANITENKLLSVGGIWTEYNNIFNKLTITEIMQRNIYKFIYLEDRKKYEEILDHKKLLKAYDEGITTLKCEVRRIMPDDNIKWLELTINLFQNPYKKDILGLLYLKDIDSKKREELLLNDKNMKDNLTGLFNKSYIQKQVDSILKENKENNLFSMILIKIENFENINYLWDETLKYIGHLSRYIFDENAIISRTNECEFVIFFKIDSKKDVENKIYEFSLRIKEFDKIEISCDIAYYISDKGSYIDLYTNCSNNLFNIKDKELRKIYLNDNSKSLEIDKQFSKTYTSIDEILLNEVDLFSYVIDAFNYKILDANENFFKVLNKTKEECLGRECYKVIHNKNKPCSFCKNMFWNSKDFFVWKQYNKFLEKDFLLKNKLISFNNKKCMLTLATNISLNDKKKSTFVKEDISKIMRNIMYHLTKRYSYENNIGFILELISSFHQSKFAFVFELDTDNSIITHSINNSFSNNKLKEELEKIVLDEFIFSNVDKIKYFRCEQEVITISYNLYNLMSKYHLLNMIIVPIKNKNNIIGYIVCINNNNFEQYIENNNFKEYLYNIAYLIGEEIIKNNIKKELDLEKNYDSLTGVLNRDSYRSYENSYDADKIKNIGVLCLSVNELNSVNHSIGILAGDNVLLNLVEILKNHFFDKLIFRLNGNEFLVIMENIDYENFIKEIEKLIKKLENVGLSIIYGKAWSSDEKELNYLVNSAIYFRKMKNQKNKQLVNNNNLYKRNTLLTQLMLDIESKEYEIFLQPKISLTDNSLCGAEALIRKRNSEGGYVPPDKFIPILEHHYLIQYIDLFVLEEVFKVLEILKSQNKNLIPISLNFSRNTLKEDDIVKSILDIKNKHNIDLKYIEIEVTESIENLEKQAICKVLKEIENIGISILLDDFGVKYSNLSILSDINFHGLKLDKSMVKNLGENTTNEIIMKNIICMCKDLNIKTIAEGVETIEQKNILEKMNCDISQGYLHSKPLPVNEFLNLYYNN
ncbi:EAL domain-containing protein [[Clostridium] colinum]|uniref:EAL domain-containing protein n=1 Tax=[Clostridium] colinum TaxID=36835 RepID=UPI00202459EA|nr:EAL domain-containing protein [[Clostridium] colinum]